MTAGAESRGAGPRTIELLRHIASGEREFALKDLAERAGLAPSTVHRLLEFWVRRDLIERAGPKAYRLGPELFRLASLIARKFELPRIARPFLESLWKDWQETASLCLYRPAMHSAMVAESIASPHPLQFVLTPYSEISLPWGSLGRSILAHLPPQEIEAILADEPRSPLSGRPLPPRRAFRDELRRIRERGYAVYEDDTMNIAGVSSPVFAAGDAIVGCIGVTMPASRFGKPVRDGLPRAVLESARQLSKLLGSS